MNYDELEGKVFEISKEAGDVIRLISIARVGFVETTNPITLEIERKEISRDEIDKRIEDKLNKIKEIASKL